MHRSGRIVIAVLALVLLVAGTAFATRSTFSDLHNGPVAASHSARPTESEAAESPEPNGPKDANETNGAALTDAHAQALVDLLKAAGITATAGDLKTLAAKYGVGGAVRLEAWAAATGKSVSDLAAMFDGGMGWGAIAHQLEAADSSLHLSPGIGWIMGHGHGHGNGDAAAAHAKGKPASS
ncbi:MAG TPA: hypothetical protein VKU35_03335 [Candidatus Limnocylindria bacterium]|nr:hypothetical protein [Candidatus Limnocylindria bacterium]